MATSAPYAAHVSVVPRLRDVGTLSAVDRLIVGALILFLAVFAFELLLVVPCGGWQNVSRCTSSLSLNGAWSSYFRLDPFWNDTPAWYVAVMNLQDFIFNPFWAVSLYMYLTRRQDIPWFRTATIAVSSMIITTSIVTFLAQCAYPGITGEKLAMLVAVNGPWLAFPLLFIIRMHRAGNRAQG